MVQYELKKRVDSTPCCVGVDTVDTSSTRRLAHLFVAEGRPPGFKTIGGKAVTTAYQVQ